MSKSTVNREDYFDSRPFLKGTDIKDKTQVTIEMFESIPTRVSKKPRPCLRFKGYDAPLGLNVTNFNRMVEKYGDDSADWVGKKIVLRRVMMHNPTENKETPAIRIE